MERVRIETENAPPSTGFRSQGMVAGGLFFTGGMIGSPMLPEGGVRAPAATLEEQVDLCLRHLEQVGLAAGIDRSQVIEVSAFLVEEGREAEVAEWVTSFLGFRPLLFNPHKVSDCAMHGLVEMDWIAVADPALSPVEAASWVTPLGHGEEIIGSGPFWVLNGVTAEGATLGEQSFALFRKVERQLGAVGSGLDDLVKMTVYIADYDSYPQFNDATRSLFQDFTPPTRSVVVAPEITGRFLLKIDLLAVRRT